MPDTLKQTSAATALPQSSDEFQRLLIGVISPPTTAAREAILSAVQKLAQQALDDSVVISNDAVATIKAMIAEIDHRLTRQINVILHHEKFQALERAWRGLHHLVGNVATDAMLKIKVMNISKDDLAETLGSYSGSQWDQSPLFRQIYENTYGTPGGKPFGCLVGDYYFDHTPRDVALLGQIAQIAAAAHVPFISGTSPSLLQLQSWQDITDVYDIKEKFEGVEYAAWRSLREAEDSKYLGLTLPRFLARLPYGPNTAPVKEFVFEEEIDGIHDNYVWANAAYAMAVNIANAFKQTGWCTAIRGLENGGAVRGLPVHTFPSESGGIAAKCPTEIALTERREKELSDAGLIPLSFYVDTDYAVFFSAQSLHKPAEYQGRDGEFATANAKLSANLPNLFASCRFAHYLKQMVRDKIATFKEKADMERYLSEWIQQYVLPDPEGKPEEFRARMPLRAAQVEVNEVPGNPGYYEAKFYLRPHYQLEGMDIELSLVSQLPQERAA